MTVARAAVLLLVCGVATACAQQATPGSPGPGFVLVEPPPEEVPVPEEGLVAEPLPEERPHLPPVTAEMGHLLETVQQRFGDDPDLGASEVSLDRTLITLRWHGVPPRELTTLVRAHADAPFEVRLESTPFRPTDLTEEAGRLVALHPGVVTMAGPRSEGDGVTVGIDPAVDSAPDQADLARLGVSSRFPLFPRAEAQPVPAAGG